MGIRIVNLASLILVFALVGSFSLRPADGEEQGPSAYQKAVKGSEAHPGFLDLRVKGGKVFAELSKGDFDQDFLMMASVARGIGARYPFYSGTTLNPDFIMAFRKSPSGKVHLVRRVTRYRGQAGTPLGRAVDMAFSDAVVTAVPVVAEEGGKTLIDLGLIFNKDFLGLAPYLSRALGGRFGFDPNKSEWGKVKSFPHNTELRVRAVFSGAGDEGEDIVPDPRGVVLELHYSLRSLADLKGYQPRLADDRVGYFLTVHKNFSSEGPENFIRYINRWRLEKADPDAEVSAPKTPIIFWMENTIPYKWRHWIREGIEAWNRAYREAGFVGAIEVRQMPDDADWDPEDARYNTFRWVTSTELGYGAIGPSRVNPLTGEILDADILLESEQTRGFSNIYKRYTPDEDASMAKALDDFDSLLHPRGLCAAGLHRAEQAAFGALAQRLLPGHPDDVPEEYLGAMLRGIAMHEVGHTLGLRHNFKGSSWVPNDRLQDAEWTKENGLTASTMDYLPVNFSDDPKKQGEYFESRVGPYDVWAIRYGYTPLKGDTWAERKGLLEIAAESAKPGHAYGTDEDTRAAGSMDPQSTIDDIGSDLLEYGQSRMRLIDKIFAADWNRLANEEDGYVPVRSGVTRTFNAKAHTIGLVAKYVGGVYHRRHHPGTETDETPIAPVDAGRQREALDFVLTEGFAPDSWSLSPELMRLLAPSRWSHWGSNDRDQDRLDWSLADVAREKQNMLLRQVFMPIVQERIIDNELRALEGETPFTLAELYTRVTEASFQELEGGQTIPPLRRQLQSDLVDLMRTILLGGMGSAPEEARNQAWAVLDGLRQQLAAVNPTDLATRAHVRRLQRDVQSALDAYTTQR